MVYLTPQSAILFESKIAVTSHHFTPLSSKAHLSLIHFVVLFSIAVTLVTFISVVHFFFVNCPLSLTKAMVTLAPSLEGCDALHAIASNAIVDHLLEDEEGG